MAYITESQQVRNKKLPQLDSFLYQILFSLMEKKMLHALMQVIVLGRTEIQL